MPLPALASSPLWDSTTAEADTPTAVRKARRPGSYGCHSGAGSFGLKSIRLRGQVARQSRHSVHSAGSLA